MHRLDMSDEVWLELLEAKRRGQALHEAHCPARHLYGRLLEGDAFVMAQVGQTLDGRVSTLAGDARDISGPEGLRHLHRIRALMDAVLVGSGTILADNPLLTVREVQGQSPVRVIIDRRGELTGQERIFCDESSQIIVLQGERVPARHLRKAKVVPLQDCKEGLAPAAILEVLASFGLRRILVEGGARTIARFMAGGCLDRLHVCISPLIVGSGKPGFSLPPIDRLSEAWRPDTDVYALGRDILFDCDMRNAPA